MKFDINTFMDDIRNLGKLKTIIYDNGDEAYRILNAVQLTRKELVGSLTDSTSANAVDEQLDNPRECFGYLIGRLNKGMVGELHYNLNAFLLRDGRLAIYSPYNDILSLQISGSRKYTFDDTTRSAYSSTPEALFAGGVLRGKGEALFANFAKRFSWKVPDNAVVALDLAFTRTLEKNGRVDNLEYNGVILH